MSKKVIGLIISPVIGAITENNLEVDNYVVVSVGKVTYEGQTGVVTIGLLNNVFTPGKEKVREALREAF